MILCSEQGSYGGVHKQTLLLDYPSMIVKQLDYSMSLKGKPKSFYIFICFLTNLNLDEFKPPGIITFTLKNQVYLTAFHEAMVEILEFDENEESFVLKQQMNLKKSYLLSAIHISATPFWK